RTLSAAIDADPKRRARVEEYKRAMRDALKLAAVREARGLTQQELAGALNTSQANVSRVEREPSPYLSTLESYVAALGGRVEITAVFPDARISLLPNQGTQDEQEHEVD